VDKIWESLLQAGPMGAVVIIFFIMLFRRDDQSEKRLQKAETSLDTRHEQAVKMFEQMCETSKHIATALQASADASNRHAQSIEDITETVKKCQQKS
jgi:predicted HTH transcriptional regulator